MEDSNQGIKINGTYMSFEMNMFIIYNVDHLTTEKDEKNLQNSQKVHLKILTLLL